MINSSLSNVSKQVILGSVLGDGFLQLNEKNVSLSVRHSVKRHEYIFWKINCLQNITLENDFFINENDLSSQLKMGFQTSVCESLMTIFNLVGNRKIEVKRKWLNQLTPLGLCVWWLDDGCIVADNKGFLCTEAFSYDEQLLMVRYFRVVWKINPKIVQRKIKYRLRFNATELKKLLLIVLPFIPVKNMLYKGVLLYKNTEMQERWISEVERLSCFTRKDVEECIQTRKQILQRFSKEEISENDIVHTRSNMGRI